MEDEYERNRLARMNRKDAEANSKARFTSSAAFVGAVASATEDIIVGHYLMMTPGTVLGTNTEGSAAVLETLDQNKVPALLLGPGLPATGDYLIARYQDNRWAVERMTGAGTTGPTGALPNCFCNPIPATLNMTSYSTACNYGMFQSGTIQYGPTPAGFLDLDIGVNSFLGVESFPDITANGALFRYLLTCLNNQFNLSRVYLTSPYGSPYRDGLLYTWLVGGYGNTCKPFHLDDGLAYAGSDQTCYVTIDE